MWVWKSGIPIEWLVGAFKHEFYFPFHIWDVILPKGLGSVHSPRLLRFVSCGIAIDLSGLFFPAGCSASPLSSGLSLLQKPFASAFQVCPTLVLYCFWEFWLRWFSPFIFSTWSTTGASASVPNTWLELTLFGTTLATLVDFSRLCKSLEFAGQPCVFPIVWLLQVGLLHLIYNIILDYTDLV